MIDTVRAQDVRRGLQLEVFTVVWMVAEAALALLAGISAGSVLMTAFGLDSVIELVSGTVILWRLNIESKGITNQRAESVEHRAAWVVAITLALLCGYVLASSIVGLVAHTKPESSWLGIGVALAAVLVMPVLGLGKRRVADRIDSGALRGDAAESFTCGYMAATVLVGLALNAIFGWGWIEYVAALAFLGWLILETREAFEGASGGGSDGDD